MILRKSPSAFLRALRSVPADTLPALKVKKLSRRQMKRLEDAVFARIAASENRTVFDEFKAVPPAVCRTDTQPSMFAPDEDSAPHIEVIGVFSWKKALPSILAACLCFAVLVTGVFFRGDIAIYLANHGWIAEAESSTDYTDTQALNTDVVLPPDDTAENFSLEITEMGYHDQTGYPTLILQLTTNGEPMEGISVQYSRVTLSLWDPDVRVWRAKYDVYTSGQPIAAVIAGDLHFPVNGQEAVSTVEGVITVPRDIRGYTGVWCLSLEGLTLVRDDPDSTKDIDLIAEVLTDGTVNVLFPSVKLYEPADPDSYEVPPNRDTETPPPTSACRPLNASDAYSLLISHTNVKDNLVTLDVVLGTPMGKPDGYAVYYKTCEIELWNHEKQVWEGKFGTDSDNSNAPMFEQMLVAGDVQFVVDRYTDNTYGTLSYELPDHGWFRIALSGLILVREAREGEESAFYNLVCETLEEGSIYAVFHKDRTAMTLMDGYWQLS